MEFDFIEVEIDNNVAKITLSNPDMLNTFTRKMALELHTSLRNIERNDEVRTVVLSGLGRAFSAGGNVHDLPTGKAAYIGKKYMDLMHRWFLLFYHLSKPTIAAVNGLAIGTGFNVVLAADIVLASEKSFFGQAFAKVGLISDLGGLYLLPRLVGLNKAKELILTGATISASEAHELGIVNRVVAHDKLSQETEAIAHKIASGPRHVARLSKAVMHKGLSMDIDSFLELEAYAQSLCLEGKEHIEGAGAFLNKREPDFLSL